MLTQQYAYHYITDSPAKIVTSCKRFENKSIEIYMKTNAMAQPLLSIYEQKGMLPPLPVRFSIDELYDKVVIKKYSNLVSVYPIFETELQCVKDNNQSWLKFDSRKSSQAQKYGSLLVQRAGNRVGITLWRQGNRVIEEEFEINENFSSASHMNLLNLEIGIFASEWSKMTPMNEEVCPLDFPLFLPDDWKHKWIIASKSRFLLICN